VSVRDSFFIYEGLRRAFLLGLQIKPILAALDTQPGERILDAGCGFGHLARHFNHCDYTGIDSDPERIDWAKQNIGESPTRRFLLADVCRTGLEPGCFDKAIGYGLIHHLSDETARRCLRELSRIVKGKIVFSDPVYSSWHLINNLLCRLDRGAYVRNSEQYLGLCRSEMLLESSRFFYANNRLARYFLMACSRKIETAQVLNP